MTHQTTPTADERSGEPTPRSRASWARWAVAIVFGLLFAYDLFEALANLTGVLAVVDAENAVRASVDVDLISPPWALLVATLALPVVGYPVSLLVGRRRSTAVAALVFAAGLAVVAALTLSITAFA